jgi:hypothetical protein
MTFQSGAARVFRQSQAWFNRDILSIVIPNEVSDLYFYSELQIPHFVRDDKSRELDSQLGVFIMANFDLVASAFEVITIPAMEGEVEVVGR